MSETKTKPSVLEVADSVTGYEEEQVIAHFGRPLGDLQLSDSARWARALVFVLKRREDVVDVDAKDAVMSMSIKDVWQAFHDEDAESGKDEPGTEPQPESLQPSAS